MIEYKHQIFLDRVARPAHLALEGRHLHEWIEERADQLALVDGHRASWGFGEAYKRTFSIALENVVTYAENPTLSAGIRLMDGGHEVSVQSVSGRDRRALLAHELGHALIFNHKPLWSRITRSRLLVDPLQERLVDDIARSLLIPKTALSPGFMDMASDPAVASSMIADLTHFYNVPIRIVLARVLRYLSCAKSAIIYAIVPLQRELFAPKELRPTNRARTKWIIEYTPIADRYGCFYPFIDFVEVNKALEPRRREDLPIFEQVGQWLDKETVQLLTRRTDQHRIKKYNSFRTLALVDSGEHRHLAILCA